jgi:hypothetical protein
MRLSTIKFKLSAPCRGTPASRTNALKSCELSREQIPPFAQYDVTNTLPGPQALPRRQDASNQASSESCVPDTLPR